MAASYWMLLAKGLCLNPGGVATVPTTTELGCMQCKIDHERP